MTKPYTLHLGDCIEVMRTLADNSVDSIVCDPPYELGFMGKSWDASGIAYKVDMWREALRVLKPGGHLLAFSGSRTYHRMACAIEDAGFEIRDQIMWVYGSGFPKSLDVSKAIDKAAGADREVVGRYQPPNGSTWNLKNDTARSEVGAVGHSSRAASLDITAPATDAARQWSGWGTALKPAHEPICVARKPLVGTVAANVLQFGTGALNIDGCRVATETPRPAREGDRRLENNTYAAGLGGSRAVEDTMVGRWPANLIHDGSAEVVALFPQAKSGGNVSGKEPSAVTNGIYGEFDGRVPFNGYSDTGSAARFFYCAKASKTDRNEGVTGEPQPFVQFQTGNGASGKASSLSAGRNTAHSNTHPTVKPTDLMAYLCRLVTPPGGLVLDPFMGSGSTGKACMREGFEFVGIDMTPEYVEIAAARIEHELGKVQATREAAERAAAERAAEPEQLSLLG